MTATATSTHLDPFEEVRQLVEEAIANAGTQYHTGLLALELRDRIRADRPDLWDAWTNLMSLDALKTAIGRFRNVNRRPMSAFRRAGYAITEEVDSSHTQRQFGDMTRSDLDYVARRYMRLAGTFKKRAQRVRALYDRLPDEKALLRDHVPEEDVAAIFKP